MISISIVEDDHEIRNGLVLIIDGTQNFSCVGDYGDAETALEEIEEIDPDVVLMDVTLPGMSGIDCVRRIKEKLPDIDIIMLTIREDDQTVFDALCAGASGYLTKNTHPDVLVNAIEEASKGGAPMSTNIARMVVRSFQRNDENVVSLSEREGEVLTQLCKGESYNTIAETLFISRDTVRFHIKNIYRKLEVHSKSEAVAKAMKERIVDI